MRIRKRVLALLCAAVGGSAHAATLTSFSYTQGDAATGSGTIAGFSYDPGDGGGPITFGPTAMPAAVVVNPQPGLTPAGFVGAQNTLAGNSNEGNVAVGLTFSGSVTAAGTRGAENYTINIPLVFAPKQTQVPDVSDYNWNVAFGDNAAGGTDTTSTSMRFAMWLGRDTTADNVETSNTFQRYTQLNHTFVGGQDNFTNSNTTNGTVKDATDPGGAPTGTDAAGNPLGFYYGWRDQGALTTGAILVDSFAVGGLLVVDEASLTPPVPEPAALGVLLGGGLLALRRRRRA